MIQRLHQVDNIETKETVYVGRYSDCLSAASRGNLLAARIIFRTSLATQTNVNKQFQFDSLRNLDFGELELSETETYFHKHDKKSRNIELTIKERILKYLRKSNIRLKSIKNQKKK